MPIKILHIGKYYPPHPGGIETFNKSLVDGLHAEKFQVTQLCLSEDSKYTEEQIGNIRLIRVPTYGTIASQPIAPSLPFKIVSLAKSHDIVHVHSPHPLTELACLLIPQRTPIVVSHHSDILRQKTLFKLYKPFLHLFLQKAAKVVGATINHIKNSNILPEYSEKCETIPYGIDPQKFELTAKVQTKRDKLVAQYGPYILFVGRLVSYKGVDILLQAMQNLDCNCVIVGDGPLRAELEHLSKKLGVDSKVFFRGKVKDNESFVAYYYGCEAFVLPSVSPTEAFGIVLTEAMICQKPLVTTNLDSGVSIVNVNQKTGFQVDPKNPQALAEAINVLISNSELKERLGKAARGRFHQEYSQDVMVKRYEKLYQSLVCSN